MCNPFFFFWAGYQSKRHHGCLQSLPGTIYRDPLPYGDPLPGDSGRFGGVEHENSLQKHEGPFVLVIDASARTVSNIVLALRPKLIVFKILDFPAQN